MMKNQYLSEADCQRALQLAAAGDTHELARVACVLGTHIVTKFRIAAHQGIYDAEDLVHEGVVKVLEASGRYQCADGKAFAFLTTIIHNRIYNVLGRETYVQRKKYELMPPAELVRQVRESNRLDD